MWCVWVGEGNFGIDFKVAIGPKSCQQKLILLNRTRGYRVSDKSEANRDVRIFRCSLHGIEGDITIVTPQLM